MSKKGLSEEDKALFQQAMKGVNVLKAKQRDTTRVTPPPTKPSSPLLNSKNAVESTTSDDSTAFFRFNPAMMTKIYLSNHYTQYVDAESVLSYSVPGLPKKRFKQLKSGLIAYEGRLDLHGMRQEEAEKALIHFIAEQIELAHRCVLIIHGKGQHQGQAPLLKNLINHWLPQLPQVLAFHSALNKDGGNGALYLLLRKSSVF